MGGCPNRPGPPVRANSRANHTVRMLPPSVSQEHAEAHDEGGGPPPAWTVKSFDGDQACLPYVRSRDHQNHKQANLVSGHMAGGHLPSRTPIS